MDPSDPVDSLSAGIIEGRTKLATLRDQLAAAGLSDLAAALYSVDALVAMLAAQVELLREEVRGSSRPSGLPRRRRTSRRGR